MNRRGCQKSSDRDRIHYLAVKIHLRVIVLVGLLAVALCLSISSREVSAATSQSRTQPVEPCFKHHGRMQSRNGVALAIWLIGTTRIVAVDNDYTELPPLVQKYLEITSPNHSYIYGDFDICPLEVDIPGHMRRVRVAGGEKLVVQNLRTDRPPFRLLITWRTVESLSK